MIKPVSKVFFSLLLIAVVIPQVASASVWNPFSWFAKATSTVEKVGQMNLDSVPTTTSTVSNEKIAPAKPVVVEKVITKVVQVDNPELQARIDVLMKLNADLNSRVNEYVSRINECKEELASKSSDDNTLAVSLSIVNGSDLKITEVSPNTVSQERLKNDERIELTVSGVNFQNSSGQHGGRNLAPVVSLSGYKPLIPVDSFSADGTSLRFTIPVNAIPDVISDSSGNVYPAFTFKILRQRIADKATGGLRGNPDKVIDQGAVASFTIPIR